MNRKYSQSVKDFAAKTYIHDDVIIPKIKEDILAKFEVDVPEDTLYQWSKEQGWKDLKSKAIARSRDKMVELEASHRRLDSEAHLDQYKKITSKASDALDVLQFDRASDAAKAVDMAIKGERLILEGLIARKFIQGIVSIIMEEVSDKEIRQRLGTRLQDFLLEFEDVNG
jgi:hypothetical protein|tara:strand:- start:1674 stop:2183 length:510 start_codon:yes stop_codon:yes gene_type:complete